MRTKSLLVVLVLAGLTACGGGGSGGEADDDAGSAPASDGVCAGETTDLLAEVCEEGVLTVSTDPAYPPQSKLNEQTGEYEGFDIDVATEIATRLGVDVALGDAGLGRHHRRQLERSLGHHGGLDDAHERPAGGALLHRAVQLRPRRGRGPG